MQQHVAAVLVVRSAVSNVELQQSNAQDLNFAPSCGGARFPDKQLLPQHGLPPNSSLSCTVTGKGVLVDEQLCTTIGGVAIDWPESPLFSLLEIQLM